MHKLKQNYLTEEWVFFSTVRNKRPQQFKIPLTQLIDDKTKCPFCLENKFMTEKEILVSSDKRVRLIRNKFPAISDGYGIDFGIHDVVIDTNLHEERFANFSIKDIEKVLDIIQKRMIQLGQIDEIKHVQVFKNEGNRAGASIFHSHFQIVATPVILFKQKIISKNFKKYHDVNRCCFLCDELEKMAKSNKKLIIYENKEFVAFSPECSTYTNGIDIAPKFHISDFRNLTKKNLLNLSEVMSKILKGYMKKFKVFNYNISFQIAPFGQNYETNHLYIQIIPRNSSMAGFEFSTGSFINSVLPEDFAEEFRSDYL